MYYQGSEFIGRESRKHLIEKECGRTAKPRTLVNFTSNVMLEPIHQVLGNIVRNFNTKETYVDGYDPWSVILTASAYVIFSTTNRLKFYSRGQFIFVRYMVLLIKHKVD